MPGLCGRCDPDADTEAETPTDARADAQAGCNAETGIDAAATDDTLLGQVAMVARLRMALRQLIS